MSRPREKYWYAIRVFKDMPGVKAEFARKHLKTFVPYRVEENLTGGVKYKEVPLIDSLIFLEASEKYIRQLRYDRYPHVMYYRDFATGGPGRIPDEEMDLFRKVTSPLGKGVEFFDEDSPEFHTGQKVLITEGKFKGYTGNIFRIGKDRKVIVSVAGNFSFRLDIHPRFLQAAE